MFDQRGHKKQGSINGNNNNNGEDFMPGTDRHTIPGVECHNRRKPGNIYFNSNEPDCRRNINVNLSQVGYVFDQHNDKDVI